MIAGMVVELLEEIMALTGDRQFDAERNSIAHACAHLLANDFYTVLLARMESGGSSLGFITLTEVHALYAGGTFGMIPEFYVRPGFRSEGIGRTLLDAAKAHAREKAWTRLEVTTPPLPQFERTLKFYETQGFEVSGGRKMKIQF